MTSSYVWPVALVSGASSPVGKEIVRVLSYDYIVYAHYNINEPEDKDTNDNIHWIQSTFNTEDDCKKLVQQVIDKHGKLNLLVNAIGPIVHTDVKDLTGTEWQSQLHLNLDVVFYLCQHARFYIEKEKHKGNIINFSYAGAEHIKTQLDTLPYSIAKTGILTLSKTLAASMAPSGARCNVIAAGFIDSEIVLDSTRERAKKMVPTGRMAKTVEIAESVTWLLEAPRYVTGAVINVAGGLEFP